MPAFLGWSCLIALLASCHAASLPAAEELEESLQQLRELDSTNTPNSVAAAWRVVAQADAQHLPQVLAAIQGSRPLAANWIRGAVDAMAERALANKQPLPTSELEQFIANTRLDPLARRLAFELLRKAEPALAQRLIPDMLQDPSVELRRESVALRMEQAQHTRQSGRI